MNTFCALTDRYRISPSRNNIEPVVRRIMSHTVHLFLKQYARGFFDNYVALIEPH